MSGNCYYDVDGDTFGVSVVVVVVVVGVVVVLMECPIAYSMRIYPILIWSIDAWIHQFFRKQLLHLPAVLLLRFCLLLLLLLRQFRQANNLWWMRSSKSRKTKSAALTLMDLEMFPLSVHILYLCRNRSIFHCK